MGMAEIWTVDFTAPPTALWHLQTHFGSQEIYESETVATDWKNYTLRSFTICTSSQILLGQLISRRMRWVMRGDFGGKPVAENLL
jgi:hypothetical protein